MEFPQVVTTISDGVAPLSTVIDGAWVSVTSVNGMTGDVLVEPIIKQFEPHHYYQKDNVISRDGKLYWAKKNFNSSDTFNIDDWTLQTVEQEQADWNEEDSSLASYIKNKPELFSGSYSDLSDKPILSSVSESGSYNDLLDKPTIGSGVLSISKNGSLVGSFGANSVSNSSINIEISKSDVGLSQVDNTSDINKPISNAVELALGEKVDKDDSSVLLEIAVPSIPATASTSTYYSWTGMTFAELRDGILAGRAVKVYFSDGSGSYICNRSYYSSSSKDIWLNIIVDYSANSYVEFRIDEINGLAMTAKKRLLSVNGSDYRAGDVLCVAQNTQTLSGSWTTKTEWSLGSWTQYGRMANSEKKNMIYVTVPSGEEWDVELRHICQNAQAPSDLWSSTGIYELNSSSRTFFTSSLQAFGIKYNPQTSSIVRKLSAGVHKFGVYVYCSASGTFSWYGGGTDTGTGGDFSIGPSCIFSATLIAKRSV